MMFSLPSNCEPKYIHNEEQQVLELENRFSSYEHLLLYERTWV